MAKLHAVTQKKVENINMRFHNYHSWRFSRILTQMIEIVFYSYTEKTAMVTETKVL